MRSAGPKYANPDVTALFDTVELTSVGPDRVAITGVRGAPAPEKLKVAVNLFAGFRNTMSLVLTGRDARAKADLVLGMVAGVGLADARWATRARVGPLPVRESWPKRVRWTSQELAVALDDVAGDDPASTAAAQGHLRITVKDPRPEEGGQAVHDRGRGVGARGLSGHVPHRPSRRGDSVRRLLADVDRPRRRARDGDGRRCHTGFVPTAWSGAAPRGPRDGSPRRTAPIASARRVPAPDAWAPAAGTVLGDLVGARSGDKGGNANVGVWIPGPGEGPSAEPG